MKPPLEKTPPFEEKAYGGTRGPARRRVACPSFDVAGLQVGTPLLSRTSGHAGESTCRASAHLSKLSSVEASTGSGLQRR